MDDTTIQQVGQTDDTQTPIISEAKINVIPDLPNLQNADKMQDLLEGGVQIHGLKVGDVVEGTLIAVGKREMLVDIPGFGIGVVRGREFYGDNGSGALSVGDKVSGSVVDTENREGMVELSLRKAGLDKSWQELQRLLDSKEVFSAKITGANKGGLMVTVCGIGGFLPVSQLTLEHYPRVEDGDKQKILQALQKYIGQNFTVQVITANMDEDKLIVSEKAAFEQDTEARLSQVRIGDEVVGTVTGIVDFGIFIRFGELEGLAHISELAWQRIDHPKDKFAVGQEVKAKIIGIDKGRVSLSIKQLQSDPWQEATAQYQVGQTVEGKVTKLLPFGAFVELQKDVQGLAHIAELSHLPIKHPEEVLKIGETYKFKIIGVEPANHRIGLSYRALQEKPEKTTAGETTDTAKPKSKEVVEQAENIQETVSEEKGE